MAETQARKLHEQHRSQIRAPNLTSIQLLHPLQCQTFLASGDPSFPVGKQQPNLPHACRKQYHCKHLPGHLLILLKGSRNHGTRSVPTQPAIDGQPWKPIKSAQPRSAPRVQLRGLPRTRG